MANQEALKEAREIFEPELIKCLKALYGIKYKVQLSTKLQDMYEGIDIYLFDEYNVLLLLFDSKAVTKNTREKHWKKGKCNYSISANSYNRPTDNKCFAFAEYDDKTFEFSHRHIVINAERCKLLIDLFGVAWGSKNGKCYKTKNKDEIKFYVLSKDIIRKNANFIIDLDGKIYF